MKIDDEINGHLRNEYRRGLINLIRRSERAQPLIG